MPEASRFSRACSPAANSEADPAHDREPVAVFTGEVLPLYAGDLDDDTVRTLLNELASEIGSILEQEEVYVGYRDRTWTLKSQERSKQARYRADRITPPPRLLPGAACRLQPCAEL